jgi:hypothetical protein
MARCDAMPTAELTRVRLLACLLVVAAATGVACQCASPDLNLRYPCDTDDDCSALGSGYKCAMATDGIQLCTQCLTAVDVCGDSSLRPCGERADGCGGTISCGVCDPGEGCGARVPGVCGACLTCEDLAGDGSVRPCGELADGCGGTISCGCGSGEGCGAGGVRGVCGACQTTDEPDDEFLDTNCDLLDGVIEESIFVAQGGVTCCQAGAGTMALPVRSVEEALKLVAPGRFRILVSGGTYQETLQLQDVAASIHGGYWRLVGDGGVVLWQRGGDGGDVIFLADVPASHSVRDAGTCGDAGTCVLDHLTLRAERPNTTELSSVGLYVENAQLILRRVRIESGPGVGGIDGIAGADGDAGLPGDAGLTGSMSNLGGPGGKAAPCNVGGAGGTGGATSMPGDDAPAGSMGGGPGSDGVCGVQATDGLDGTGAPPGAAGASAAEAPQLGTFSGTNYQAPIGARGEPGTPGGGGGGGGGGGQMVCSTLIGGGGGGGGGSGGCGGQGGQGGTGGGASVAIVVGSNGGVLAEEATLVTAGGGRGGNGADGGAGGRGGIGGRGGDADGGAGRGGAGGLGGPGGPGGPGAGGPGGPSVGIWCLDGGSASATGFLFEIGQGGDGGYSSGRRGPDGKTENLLFCP